MLTARNGIGLAAAPGASASSQRQGANMAHGPVLGRGGRWATTAAAAVQAMTAGGIALHALAGEQGLDGGWSALALLAILLTPAFLAVVGMTIHRAGLFSAAVSTFVL